MMAAYIVYFSKATSYVTTSECESNTQAANELNESYKLNDSEIEGSDDLGDSAASSLTDDDDELDDIVDEVTLTTPQVDNSSHASLPTGSNCDILLQADSSVEQKLEIIEFIILLQRTPPPQKLSMERIMHFSIDICSIFIGWAILSVRMDVFVFLAVCLVFPRTICKILCFSHFVTGLN